MVAPSPLLWRLPDAECGVSRLNQCVTAVTELYHRAHIACPLCGKSLETRCVKGFLEAQMILRTLIHLSTDAMVIVMAMALGLPFFLALISPFI